MQKARGSSSFNPLALYIPSVLELDATMAASPDQSRGPKLTVFCIVMMVLSILAVILRIWSRATSKRQRFWWDDWCAIASLV